MRGELLSHPPKAGVTRGSESPLFARGFWVPLATLRAQHGRTHRNLSSASAAFAFWRGAAEREVWNRSRGWVHLTLKPPGPL